MNIDHINNRVKLQSINKLIITLIFCFEFSIVLGQQEGDPFQNNPAEKMFLPTPEQASLMKFVDIPAGNHTGVHGFSVPIHTIQDKDFSLPIAISYHGGGIKVDELSGSVGIGWALNIGGISFSEEVRGERDLDGLEKLNYFDPQSFNTDYGDPSQGGSEHYKAALKMTGIQTTGVEGIPTAELQPDYYSYSLLNNNGRFIRDNHNQKKPHTVPKDDIFIWDAEFQGERHQYNQRLTDNKGIDYYFSSYEQDHVPGINAPRVRYSYKIDSIVIPNSGTIKFEYYDVSYKYISSKSKTKKMITNNFPYIEEPTGTSQVNSTIREYLPKSVSYKQTKVLFKYKMASQFLLGRLDVNEGGNGIDGKKGGILEFIEVWDEKKLNDPNSSPLKKYKLITNYFQNYRLKLDKIENMIEGTDYVFSYIGEDEQKFLPERFSYAQDFWGMYNGKHDNDTSVPYYLHQKSPKGQFIPGADKHPDSAYAKIGSLQKVKLPTGGNQIFEYELDEFRNTDFPDDYVFSAIHQFEQMNFQIVAGDSHSFNVSYPVLAEQDNNVDFAQGYQYNFYFYYENNPNINLPPDGMPTTQNYYYAKIIKNEVELPQIIYGGQFTLPDDHFLPGNTYEVIIKKNGSGGTAPFATFGVEWVHDYITTPKNRSIGTLRIKSITLTDSDGEKQLKKNYSYTDFDDSNHLDLSSGIFTATKPFPHSYHTSYSDYQDGVSNPVTTNFMHIPDNALLNQNTSFGKSVVYTKVTETYESINVEENEQNHRKEYIFSPPIPYTPNSFMPALPAPHEDYRAGLLLEERIFNDQDKLVKVKKNTYNHENPDTFFNQFSNNYNSMYSGALSPSLAVSNTGFTIVYVASLPMMVYQFAENYSHLNSAWIKHLSTTEENYENGLLKMTNTTNYEYSPTYTHLNPIKIINTNSLGETLTTEYEYPQDLSGQRPWMATLVAENRISEPVVTKTYNVSQNKPLSVQETVYEKDGTTGNLLLPKYVFAKKGSETLNYSPTGGDLKITYERYDAQGNLQQYRLADGTPVSIIWGYNGQYPIAKVEGIAYTEIETEANLLAANNSLTESSFNTLRGIVNASNKYAMLTCYIYEPLVGVKMIIQPNGQKEIYEYDSAGRLMKVKDQNEKELKKIDYHYKPQP